MRSRFRALCLVRTFFALAFVGSLPYTQLRERVFESSLLGARFRTIDFVGSILCVLPPSRVHVFVLPHSLLHFHGRILVLACAHSLLSACFRALTFARSLSCAQFRFYALAFACSLSRACFRTLAFAHFLSRTSFHALASAPSRALFGAVYFSPSLS